LAGEVTLNLHCKHRTKTLGPYHLLGVSVKMWQ